MGQPICISAPERFFLEELGDTLYMHVLYGFVATLTAVHNAWI